MCRQLNRCDTELRVQRDINGVVPCVTKTAVVDKRGALAASPQAMCQEPPKFVQGSANRTVLGLCGVTTTGGSFAQSEVALESE